MQRTSLRLAVSALVLSAAGFAAPAFADDKALEEAIGARLGYYRILGINFGPLVGMAKGDMPYDAATAKLHADNLAVMAMLNPKPHFPAGSDNAAFPDKTRALPKIWSDREGLMAKGKALKEALPKLVEASDKGLDALRPAVAATGQACNSCHDDFRAEQYGAAK